MDIKFSGQLNLAIIHADNGTSSERFIVDNDSSPSRIRFDGTVLDDSGEKTPLNYTIELGLNSVSSGEIEFNQTTSNELSIDGRKLEIYWADEKRGTLWLGKGDTASNEASESDLSGTYVVGYSQVRFLGPNLTFENSMTNIPLKMVFNNYDGFHRSNRMRYDTPAWKGWQASSSVIVDSKYDVALRFNRRFTACKVAAAAGFCTQASTLNQLSGSLSILLNSGLNVTVASGGQKIDGSTLDPRLLYGKIGWRLDLFDFGKTQVAIDYALNEEVALSDVKGRSYAILLNQAVTPLSSEIFFTARNYEMEAPVEEFNDLFIVMGGIRLKF